MTRAKDPDNFKYPYIWEDDAIEIFFMPSPKKSQATVQLIINAAGTITDLCRNSKSFSKIKKGEYNSGMVCKTGRDGNGWCLEMAIPITNLTIDGIAPDPKTWRANFCRDRNVGASGKLLIQRSSWSATLSNAWNVPSRFGFLHFQ